MPDQPGMVTGSGSRNGKASMTAAGGSPSTGKANAGRPDRVELLLLATIPLLSVIILGLACPLSWQTLSHAWKSVMLNLSRKGVIAGAALILLVGLRVFVSRRKKEYDG